MFLGTDFSREEISDLKGERWSGWENIWHSKLDWLDYLPMFSIWHFLRNWHELIGFHFFLGSNTMVWFLHKIAATIVLLLLRLFWTLLIRNSINDLKLFLRVVFLSNLLQGIYAWFCNFIEVPMDKIEIVLSQHDHHYFKRLDLPLLLRSLSCISVWISWWPFWRKTRVSFSNAFRR